MQGEGQAENGNNGTHAASNSAAPEAAQGPAEKALLGMNQAFAKCLSLVCPPIQYPPHCRFNPVQQDAADTMEIETRLEEFFLHAKQIELMLNGAKIHTVEDMDTVTVPSPATLSISDLEHEIQLLETELSEKNELIEKYGDVIRGWEGKFKRLDTRLNIEKE